MCELNSEMTYLCCLLFVSIFFFYKVAKSEVLIFFLKVIQRPSAHLGAFKVSLEIEISSKANFWSILLLDTFEPFFYYIK